MEFATDEQHLLESYERSRLQKRMARKHAELDRFPGPFRLGAMQEFDCESLYFLVRALKPRTVIETGVCYGVSTAYVLEALNQNGAGKLYSIDLGNGPDEPPNDFFVPRQLKSRWHLIIGDSKQELPRLLQQLGEIDLFHHDSLHTFEHMTWEYETALPYLSRAGALSSHDVRSVLGLAGVFKPNPFAAFCERHRLQSIESFNMGVAIPRTSALSLSSEPLKRRRQG
jgi:predicted O-methyltransferase YrrM